MKTIQYPVTTALFIVALILFTACAPKAAVAQTSSSQSAQADSAIADKPGDSPEQKLKALGFHVFPSPVDLPDFTVPALSGSDLKSSELSGTVTILNFWATWCPPCKREMPSIQRLNDAMKGTAFRIVAISTGEQRKTVETFLTANRYTFPIYLDEKGQLGSSFASQGIPSTYILNKDGKVVAGIVGSREYDDPVLVAVLKEMAAN